MTLEVMSNLEFDLSEHCTSFFIDVGISMKLCIDKWIRKENNQQREPHLVNENNGRNRKEYDNAE